MMRCMVLLLAVKCPCRYTAYMFHLPVYMRCLVARGTRGHGPKGHDNVTDWGCLDMAGHRTIGERRGQGTVGREGMGKTHGMECIHDMGWVTTTPDPGGVLHLSDHNELSHLNDLRILSHLRSSILMENGEQRCFKGFLEAEVHKLFSAFSLCQHFHYMR